MEFIYNLDRRLFYLIVLGISTVAALLLTPLAKRLALHLDIVDRPGGRKIHTTVIPYLGGLSIFLAFWLAIGLSMANHFQQLTAIVVGGTLVMLLGLWDDRTGVRPSTKLIGQAIAALIVVMTGIQFNLNLHWIFNYVVSFVWIVGLSNAMNLLDNMDGLSGGSTLISAFFLFSLSAANGQFLVAGMAISLMGACLGFLRYNLPPASIFMGDAGSLFLGFMTSVISMKLRPTVDGELLGFLVAVTLLGLPVLDTTLVTVHRVWNGRPWYQGGRDHCSHRLVLAGFSRKIAVIVLYLVAAVYGTLAWWLNVAGLQPLLLGAVAVYTAVLFIGLSLIPVYGAEARTSRFAMVEPVEGFSPRPER